MPWPDPIAGETTKGLTDEQITIATQVVGYFNYVNRIADGLSVQLEEDWDQPILRMPGEVSEDVGG